MALSWIAPRARWYRNLVRSTKTGLLLDPYFSGSKLAWLLQNIVEVILVPAFVGLGAPC